MKPAPPVTRYEAMSIGSVAAGRKPNSVSAFAPACACAYGETTIIPLAPPSLAESSNLPGDSPDGPSGNGHPIWSCSVRGFACHRCCHRRGALLPHLFTLTHLRPRPFDRGLRRAVCFLCHCPSGCPDRVLPGALPCGVRTFLPSTRRFAPSRTAIV